MLTEKCRACDKYIPESFVFCDECKSESESRYSKYYSVIRIKDTELFAIMEHSSFLTASIGASPLRVLGAFTSKEVSDVVHTIASINKGYVTRDQKIHYQHPVFIRR